MDFIKRAFLYVTKKRGKSALLFIILLVIATFVLTGLSIEKATRVTQDNLRYALGGEFEMAPDYSESKQPGSRAMTACRNALSPPIWTSFPVPSPSRTNTGTGCTADL